MAKPSEEISKRLLDFVDSHPEIKKALDEAPDEMVYANIASATMIQCILDWLDERFPSENV